MSTKASKINTVFITGASGLVGSHLLLKLLQKGYFANVLIRNENSIQQIKDTWSNYVQDYSLLDQCKFIKGDLFDIHALQEGMKDVVCVYHCAALVSFMRKDRDLMLKINIEGTAQVVNIALELNVPKLCYVSSTAAIGYTNINNGVIDEENIWERNAYTNYYSISKFYAELEVWRGIEEGLPAVIVNPGMIIGPGKWGQSSTSFFNNINRGMLFYPLGGTSFIDVHDVTEIMILLAESNVTSERYILVSEHLSFKDFFAKVALALGKKHPKYPLTDFIHNLLWFFVKIMNLFLKNKIPISRESIIRLKTNSYYSNQKINQTLPVEFTPIDVSIKNTAKFFLRSLSKKDNQSQY